MRADARVAAAIEILDRIFAGEPAEKALTGWARSNRFAGSKDRAAVRDHVFDGLRKRDTYLSLAGRSSTDPSGRPVMIGATVAAGGALPDTFTGKGHGPAPLTEEERAAIDQGEAPRPDMPDWVHEALAASFGEDFAGDQARALSERAPISLRVNQRKTNRADLLRALEAEGITLRDNPLSPTALTVDGGTQPGRLLSLPQFHDGLFEMQDASSQAVVDVLEITGPSILDYCAGGGGKALALAARTGAEIVGHDAQPRRMKDIPVRAERAGAKVKLVEDVTADEGNIFDLVLVDAPCSGSGSWRRAPDAKWRFTRDDLDRLTRVQREILSETQALTAPSGILAYATCSILREENEDQKDWFLANFPGWEIVAERRWDVSSDGDGFYLIQFKREKIFDAS